MDKRFIITLSVVVTVVVLGTVGLYFIFGTGSKYELRKENVTWFDAVARCAKDKKKLAFINSKPDADHLYELLKHGKLNKNQGLWVGAACIGSRDNSATNFKGLYNGETFYTNAFTNNDKEEFCMSVMISTNQEDIKQNKTIRFNHDACGKKMFYVCDKKF